MGIAQADFRRIMGHFLSGVTVVTTVWDKKLHGITVSSFTSLSLDPPLVLICIDKRAQSHEAISKSGLYVVNILAENQENLSTRFASRDNDRFSGVDYYLDEAGLPVLNNVLAYVRCRVADSLPGGDHTIFVGEVLAGDTRDGRPLGYFRGGYRMIAQ